MSNSPATGKTKKATNKDKYIRTRVTTEAFNRVAADAKAAGYALGAYVRKMIDKGEDGFRARRRPIAEQENLSRVLAYVGNQGGLWNQMAYRANAQGFDAKTFEEAQEAARQYRDFLYEQMGRKAPPSRTRQPEFKA